MKHALLGEISPVALAREAVRAVHDRQRSATAAGFQLVEILACLSRAQRFDSQADHRAVWNDCIKRAQEEVSSLLSTLVESSGAELRSTTVFGQYRAAILKGIAQV